MANTIDATCQRARRASSVRVPAAAAEEREDQERSDMTGPSGVPGLEEAGDDRIEGVERLTPP
jgi:hypothetical protein